MSISSKIAAIEAAIENAYGIIDSKGGTVPSTQSLNNLSSAIDSIPTGSDVSGVTASAGDVLTGKDFVNSSGTLVHGSMTNRGNVTATIDGLTMETYTIQQGYHGGSGTVSLTDDIENSLMDILGEATPTTPTTYSVTVTLTNDGLGGSSPTLYTNTNGAGTYSDGDNCTITLPYTYNYYYLAYATKNGIIAPFSSSQSGHTYTFTVGGNTEIVAYYTAAGGGSVN